MTDKKKILMIYVGVGVMCLLVLGMSFFLATLKKEKRNREPLAVGFGAEEVEEIKELESDLELLKDNGERVRFSDLKEKVWLVVQFYAACPQCAKRNQQGLLEAYQKFRDRDDFVVVCVSIDPDADTGEGLSTMRSALGVDSSNWWFLKGDQRAVWDFMSREMWFARVEENTEPAEIAAKGRWVHDMGIRVFRGNTMISKWDESKKRKRLFQAIERAFSELNSSPKEKLSHERFID